MLKTLEFVSLKIPFKLSFKHNSAERKETQTLIIIADDGIFKGYGEGCPREYVTNESMLTANNFFSKVKSIIIEEICDLDSLVLFKNKNAPDIEKNHAAWCAIEIALLDLFAKQKHCSVEKLLKRNELSGEFKYTAVVGDGSVKYFTEIVRQHLKLGFNDFKLKISGNAEIDYEKIAILKDLCSSCTIRLDANNVWENTADVVRYINRLPFPISALEEPLQDKKLDSLIALSKEIKTPIILDECFNHFDDLQKIALYKEAFIINLRVSKMGGIINSLRIADFCVENGIAVNIGAQVGETSILTRAALFIANAISPHYIGLEGGYGTFLLQNDLVEKPLMFGEGGVMDPKVLLDHEVNGLQLNVLGDNLKLR